MADERVVVGVWWSTCIAEIVVGVNIGVVWAVLFVVSKLFVLYSIWVVCVVLFVVSRLFVLYYIWVVGLYMGECLLLAGRGPVPAESGWQEAVLGRGHEVSDCCTDVLPHCAWVLPSALRQDRVCGDVLA